MPRLKLTTLSGRIANELFMFDTILSRRLSHAGIGMPRLKLTTLPGRIANELFMFDMILFVRSYRSSHPYQSNLSALTCRVEPERLKCDQCSSLFNVSLFIPKRLQVAQTSNMRKVSKKLS